MGNTALWDFSCSGVSESVTKEMPAKALPGQDAAARRFPAQQNHSSLNFMEDSRAQPGPRDAIGQGATYPHSSEQHSELLDFTPSQRKALCETFSQK